MDPCCKKTNDFWDIFYLNGQLLSYVKSTVRNMYDLPIKTKVNQLNYLFVTTLITSICQ